MITVDSIFRIIEIYAPVITIVAVFVKKFKKTKWVSFLLAYSFIYILLMFIGSLHIRNILLYISCSAFAFLFFTLLFQQFLQQKFFFTFSNVLLILIFIFFIVNAIWWEGISTFNSNSSGIANLVLVSYCLYYFKLLLENRKILFIEKQPDFWIVSGIFIYSAGNFFLFITYNALTKSSPEFAFYSWRINDVIILVMNLFFAKGIQCNWQQ